MLDGSPDLVGMGGDSCFKDRGFESQHTGRTFFTFIFCKNCNVCLKKTKINEKETGDGSFLTFLSNRPRVNCPLR